MFIPKYTITNRLLSSIKRISTIVNNLNSRRFPNLILANLERIAREVSSYASTSIEGNPLPLTEVKKILKSTPAHIRESEKEVLNYNQALGELNKLLRDKSRSIPSDKFVHSFVSSSHQDARYSRSLNKKLGQDSINFSLDLILGIHKQVMAGLLPDFETGSLRQKPVVVSNPRTGQVAYLPPDAKDVKQLISGLTDFVKNNKNIIDPLILAGIFHKQFVLIHPFLDGNGRTTRLATKVLLAEMGLNMFNLFSFENYYNKNVTRYFETVGEKGDYYDLVNQIDFTDWLEYFTEGIIDELLRVQKILPKVATSPSTELQEHHRKLLKFIRKKGFIKDSDYAKLAHRAKATRALDFRKLINMGLIKRKGKGKATYYITQ